MRLAFSGQQENKALKLIFFFYNNNKNKKNSPTPLWLHFCCAFFFFAKVMATHAPMESSYRDYAKPIGIDLDKTLSESPQDKDDIVHLISKTRKITQV